MSNEQYSSPRSHAPAWEREPNILISEHQEFLEMEHIFAITVEDAQHLALKRIGRELTIEELERVQKGVEFGLELSWEDVLKTAIDEVEEYTSKNHYPPSP